MADDSASPMIDWYFDFISPFAYLQHVRLLRVQAGSPGLTIRYHPVLFAGLLGHHGHKGPAEIPEKRLMTYRFCHWLAQQEGIPFAMPAVHPFNPLPMLRSTIALERDPGIVKTLFEHCWLHSADDPGFASVEAIATLPGLGAAADHNADSGVKAKLRGNTENAVARGLFGVPTIKIGDDLFWGYDMTGMALERLENPELLAAPTYRRINSLPIGTARD